MVQVALSAVRAWDAEYKEHEWVRDWRAQRDLYRDQGRKHVQRRCRELRLGIKDDTQPLETSLLRYVIDQLAVSYRSPATRWLRRDGERLAEDSTEHQMLHRALSRSGYDAMMRRIDRDRTLYRQVIVRLYPDHRRRCVRMMPYSPVQVLRWHDPHHPDDLRDDRAIAIQLSGEPEEYTSEEGRGSLWELWERDGDVWTMTRLDRSGAVLPGSEQPYGDRGGVMPYETLPLVISYDDVAWDPWLPPRSSRTSYPLAIAATWNEVMSGIRWDSHPEVVWEQDASPTGRGVRPSDMPQQTGAGVRALLPPGVRANLLSISPQVGPALDAIDRMVQSFLHSESLPTDAFRQSQTVTALGLRQLAQPLRERQEDLRPLVRDAEVKLYEAYAAVHNEWAASWGVDPLPTDVELEVELGPVDVPTDDREETDVIARRLAARLMSPVDAIARLEGLDRAEAIARLERIRSDWEQHPLAAVSGEQGADANMDIGDGPQMASIDGESDGPSVIGAVQALSAPTA